MNLDWRRLRAVVFESDDWGLCAWTPDEQAHRVLADTPAWRAPAGRTYGRSTLESADDIARLTTTLLEFRGGDGLPPVWQANTIVAAPDFERLRPPLFEIEALPLIFLPETPSRWRRPGMWEQLTRARATGVWWPELHGLHHIPYQAWLRALRRGSADARRAHEQQCVVCDAVQASSEYDPSEPAELRASNLTLAIERFRALFGRMPGSFCPPDYRWDESLEGEAERLGVTTLQGKAEQMGHTLPRIRRLLYRYRWPDLQGTRFFMPPRITFAPCGAAAAGGRLDVAHVHRSVRTAWSRGQPAVISSHRAHYAHLDPAWSEAGRAALRDLLRLLEGDAAVFLTDGEVRGLAERGWSARPIGERGALVRYYGVPRESIRFPAPPGVKIAVLKEGRGGADASVRVENGEVMAQLLPGEYVLEWKRD